MVDHVSIGLISVSSGVILGVGEFAIDLVSKEKETSRLMDAAMQTVSSVVALEALPYIYMSDDKNTNALSGAALTSVIFSLSDKYITKNHSLVKALLMSFTAELIALYGAEQILELYEKVMPKSKVRPAVTGSAAQAAKEALTDNGPSI